MGDGRLWTACEWDAGLRPISCLSSARLAPAWKEGSTYRPDPMAARPVLPLLCTATPRRTRMNHSARLLVAATLIFAAGCTKQDWIDRTLVTVDVTGTWSGKVSGSPVGDLSLELNQQGSTVKGSLQAGTRSSSYTGDVSGPVEGTVAGDLFHFKNSRGNAEGELTVSGDEMTGLMWTSFGSRSPISLRRVDPSARPGSPPR
jgi:hypothetical protein